MDLCTCTLMDNRINNLVSVTFKYTRRPTDSVGKNAKFKDSDGDGTSEMPTIPVHNDAAVWCGDGTEYKAFHDLSYTPKALSKTAKTECGRQQCDFL